MLLAKWKKRAALTVCLALAGCLSTFPSDKIDPSGNMTRSDYLELRERANAPDQPQQESPQAPVPASAQTLPVEREDKTPKSLAPSHLVSLSVTDSVPLRDVLIELGREGKVNLEVDPRIKGGIIFSAHDQPFDVVLRRICDLAGLRFRADRTRVRIEMDEPYQHSYTLDYLSLTRSTTSEVAISTNVFDVDVGSGSMTGTGAGSRSALGGGDNNSTAKIAASATADFWGEIEKSIPQVLATVESERALLSNEKRSETPKANFSIDRQTGLVTIFGNSRQQEAVATYLKRVEHKASAQVLIEARIIEVELSEDFQSGVNWSALFKGKPGLAANFGTTAIIDGAGQVQNGLFSATLDTKDFSGLISLVRTFGTTRVLSSPRLTVMNNQTAVLKVARNEVYFLTSAQFPTTVSAGGVPVSGTPVFSSTPRTVPVGLVMTVQPAINGELGRITMTLRPTISRVVARVQDPSIGLNAAVAGLTSSVSSEVPVLAVREMDSVIQLKSGEVAVMGGLMQDSSEGEDQGVPPFDTLPIVGNLAKSRSNSGKTSELVILLRATIMDASAAPDQTDADLYEKYGRDPRPLPLPQAQKPKEEGLIP